MRKICIYIMLTSIILLMLGCGAEYKPVERKELTLNGTWDTLMGMQITISNYTEEEFDLTLDGETTHFVKAQSLPSELQRQKGRAWYIEEGADYSGPYVYIETVKKNSYRFAALSIGTYSLHIITVADINLQ